MGLDGRVILAGGVVALAAWIAKKAKGTSGVGYVTDGVKRTQLRIIQKTNPMVDDIHTGIRSIEDIKSFDELIEAFQNGEDVSLTPDFGIDEIRRARDTRHILLYSSYPIKNGVFVTPSKMIAQDYAGGGQIYKKMAHVESVAWIDFTEGVYADFEY